MKIASKMKIYIFHRYNLCISTARCTTCGYTDKLTLTPAGHQTEWQADETHHRLVCIHCGEVEQEGAHSFNQGVCACGYSDPTPVMPGDMDGNGKVNNRDLGLLQQYLNGNDMSGKTFDLTAIDLDGNGKINNRDLGLLQKLLNQ